MMTSTILSITNVERKLFLRASASARKGELTGRRRTFFYSSLALQIEKYRESLTLELSRI
jgi:hypothetical protein